MDASPGIARRSLLWGAGLAPAIAAQKGPNDKLNIAGVGVGGMGRNYVSNCESENIVALCDVDAGFAAKTFARYPKAAIYRDYPAEGEFTARPAQSPRPA